MCSLLKRTSSKWHTQIHPNWIRYNQHLQTRSYFTGTRYQGYVSYFHGENLYGFVCREDAPEREYYFHVTDLHAESIPRVRPMQAVEFGVMEGRGGNYMARDLTAPGGSPIIYNHPNMKLNKMARDRRLSQLPNGMAERHTGVLIANHATGDGGLIIPDRLNFDAVSFRSSELQCTGAHRLDRLSEIEFNVRPGRTETQMDRAICITRKGGGLITAERKETGCRRRLLGAMYGHNDLQARVPQEFKQNRQLGYVIFFDREKLHGFVLPFDDPEHTIFVHMDDCHVYGPRYLNRFQAVEYVAIRDESTGKSKALHVTAPQQTVLRSRSDNRYVDKEDCVHVLPLDTGERFEGEVTITRRAVNWFLIKPKQAGYQSLIAFKSDVAALGARGLQAGDTLEFEVTEATIHNPEQNESQLKKAVRITAPLNKPLITERGFYCSYLQSKFGEPYLQAELEECGASAENELNTGYIAAFNTEKKIGTIEIEAPVGKRYKKVLFDWNDCIVSSELDPSKAYAPKNGNKIQCRLVAINEEKNVFDEKQDNENAVRNITMQAINVVTENMDDLNVRELRDYSDSSQQQHKTPDGGDTHMDTDADLGMDIGGGVNAGEMEDLDFLKPN